MRQHGHNARMHAGQGSICVGHVFEGSRLRQVAFQDQHCRGELQPRDAPSLFDVLDDQFVGFAYICAREQPLSPGLYRGSVKGTHLGFAARPRRDTANMGGTSLKELVMGSPLGQERNKEELVKSLNSHLLGLVDLLPRVYGDSDACKQAVLEVGTLIDMDDRRECIASKRAMLLYALSSEKEVAAHWAEQHSDGSAALAKDLSTRVLPFLVPRFFKHSCQSPEAFVVMSLVMSEMWAGERLGNFPLAP